MCTAHEINSVVETETMQICGWRDLPMIQLHGNFTRMTFEPALGQGGLGFYTSPSMWATPSVQCNIYISLLRSYLLPAKVFRSVIKPLFYITKFGVVFNITAKKPDFTKSL